MRRNASIWISGLIFILLILLGPLWAFPNLQEQLNKEATELSALQPLIADGAILEWHGRNAYLSVPQGYDVLVAEQVANEINDITGVRNVGLIYDPAIAMPETSQVMPSERVEETAEVEVETSAEAEVAAEVEEVAEVVAEVEEVAEVEASLEEVAEVEEAVAAILDFSSIEFESGTADLTSSSQSVIAEIASTLNTNEAVKLVVVGYTDSQGDDEMNMQLSLERASSVVMALVAEGVSENRLTPEGRGELDPVASNDTAEGRKLNRRVEFIGLEN